MSEEQVIMGDVIAAFARVQQQGFQPATLYVHPQVAQQMQELEFFDESGTFSDEQLAAALYGGTITDLHHQTKQRKLVRRLPKGAQAEFAFVQELHV